MAPNVAVTPQLLYKIMPTQILADLLTEPHDSENDLSILLHWLLPYYLHPNTEFVTPLARVRAAARQCLREPLVQLKFVDLFVNSIEAELQTHFRPFVASAPLTAIFKQVNSLQSYYHRQAIALNFSENASDLFNRSLKALFVPYLLTPRIKQELIKHLNRPDAEYSFTSLRPFASMGMAPFIQTVVVSVTTERIHKHVVSTCSGVWDRPTLSDLQQWIRVKIYPSFAAGIFDANKTQSASSSNDLVMFAQDQLVALRTNEIYDMVVNANKSLISLSELHQCLMSGSPITRTSRRALLVDTFISHCNLNLLHLGSNTVKIILEYINTIKSFLIVDPTGVLLDKVARPMRKYLKTRRDLVSHLVKGMLDINPLTNKLFELAQTLRNTSSPGSAAIDDLTDINWYPDPIDALPDFKKGKVSDFVDAVTSILPLPTVLVEEFTKLFGAKLLDGSSNLEEIIQDVENLKSRFGQSEFATLDVMIRDVEESKIINKMINNQLIELKILSKNYWPGIGEQANETDTFTTPILEELDSYGDAFSGLKKGRFFKILPSMGQVCIELEFENCTKEFLVSPAQATVIEVFNEDYDDLSVLTITLSTGMSNYMASQALAFWTKEGVLKDLGHQRYQAVKNFEKL